MVEAVTSRAQTTNVCSPLASARASQTARTLYRVPAVSKSVTVRFYAIEPSAPGNSFASGAYPQAEVLERIRSRDPAADDYRLKDNLWGNEIFCLLQENGDVPLLIAYYKDMWSRVFTEHKGQVQEIEMREGEGVVDASYCAFFPHDVLGVVRASAKAPSFAKIGHWLSVMGEHDCALWGIPDINTLKQLDQAPDKLRRLVLRIRRRNLDLLPEQVSVATVLRTAAEAGAGSDIVGLDLAVSDKMRQPQWSSSVRAELQELFGLFPDFAKATITISGLRQPINLRRALIATTVDVSLVNTKRVGANEAAQALFAAYEREGTHLAEAVTALRKL